MAQQETNEENVYPQNQNTESRKRDRRAAEPLAKAVADKDYDVVCAALKSLGEVGGPRAIEVIAAALAQDRFRVDIGVALASLDPPPERGRDYRGSNPLHELKKFLRRNVNAPPDMGARFLLDARIGRCVAPDPHKVSHSTP